MKYLQRPIVSDSLYAPTKRQALGFVRVALHARSIEFTDQKGEKIQVEAPYPPDFDTALARYVKM
jgi:23S rRNA-/tRNA-specific pseudouridylate synthase